MSVERNYGPKFGLISAILGVLELMVYIISGNEFEIKRVVNITHDSHLGTELKTGRYK